MASTGEDQARLLVSIEATQAKFAKQLATIAKQAGTTATGIERDFKRANDNVSKGFDKGARDSTKSIRQSQSAVSNLSFQLNDIAMGLASGTSPFTIMVQQGSQVTQALAMTGGGAGGAVKALGGAFASMVNPVSLATFAVIGLGGAALQYFAGLFSDSEKSEAKLKEQAALIQKIADKWGDAVPALREYNEEVKKAVEIAELEASGKAAAGAKRDEALAALTELSKDGQRLLQQLRLSSTASAEAITELDAALRKTRAEMGDSSKTGENISIVLKALTGVMGSGVSMVQTYQSKFSLLASDMANATREAKALEEQTKSLADTMRVRAQLALNSVPSLSPLYSGGGRFLDATELPTFQLDEAALRDAGSSAAEMIKGFEGFISKSKWDVNAFRVGFGSDTTTRANGAIEKVTSDTMVTLDDAQRDLSRRIIEFQAGVQKAIGVDTWKSLTEAQQAALTSIAYNYGSLPKSIVEAIEQGGGPEIVAQAIAKLSANPQRRGEEAQTYLSGTGVSLKDAGLAGKSPSDIFKGDIADVQKRIDVLNAEFEAQAKLNPLVNDYGFAVQKARIEQQLLSDAKKAGLVVDADLAAKISLLAENYAKASSAGAILAEKNKQLASSMQQASAFGKNVLGGFISDLRAGRSATEALANALDKVADKLLDVALNSLFDGPKAGSGGGVLGKLFGFFFAKGGVAAGGRPQPLKTYARGGVSNTAAIFGEAGPEAAVPLPDGRRIPVDLRAPRTPGRGGSTETINVVLQDDSGRMAQIADQQIQSRSGTIVRVSVQQSMKAVKGQMPALMAETQSRTF